MWIEAAGVQKISLGSDFQLDGVDRITTGPNSRLILACDEETTETATEAADQLS
jgi:hypothetical protein